MSSVEFGEHVADELGRVTEEIERLLKLKASLEDLQQHLKQKSVAPAAVDAAPAVPVPPARRRPEASSASAAEPAKSATSAKPKARTTKKAAKKRRGGRAQGQPTRADLIFGLLDDEPRSVRDVKELLEKKHPADKASEPIVRATLEQSLVKLGRARRQRQGSSVYYFRAESAAENTTADGEEVDSASQEAVSAQA